MRLRGLRLNHAPEFPADLVWLNSAPRTMKGLRGKPVLIDIWTYSCRNCVRSIPGIESLYRKYKSLGLTVIGVHSPEFPIEREQKNVEKAITQLGISYPVVLDPDFKIWDLYANKYWPHAFLVDHRGLIVFDHAGEGGEVELEHAIQDALRAGGVEKLPPLAAKMDPHGGMCYRATPEMYLGYLRGHIANAGDVLPETEEAFTDGGEHKEDLPYLHGHWRISGDHIEHTRTLATASEYLALKYHAFSVHAAIGALDDREIVVDVTLDGKPVPASMAGADIVIDDGGSTHLHVTHHRLYDIIAADHYHSASLKLSLKNAGVTINALTFGGCR